MVAKDVACERCDSDWPTPISLATKIFPISPNVRFDLLHERQ